VDPRRNTPGILSDDESFPLEVLKWKEFGMTFKGWAGIADLSSENSVGGVTVMDCIRMKDEKIIKR
jgi:hypothetical protein